MRCSLPFKREPLVRSLSLPLCSFEFQRFLFFSRSFLVLFYFISFSSFLVFFQKLEKKNSHFNQMNIFSESFSQIINNNKQICKKKIKIKYQQTIECVVIYHSRENPWFVLFLFLYALLNFKGFSFFRGNLVQNGSFFRF